MHATTVEGTPYGASSTDSAFLRAVADTSGPKQLTCRQSARNRVRVDYDETKYNELEFSERNKSPKAAAVQTGPVVAQVPDVATCIPRLGRGLPSRAVNSAQAMHEELSLDVFLRDGAQANTTSINTTNRQAAFATYADAMAETFVRAASSSSTESDFSTASVANSPTASAASAASAATASTAATTATAATVPINAVNAEAVAASTSGLSKLYKYREKVNQTVAASWSAATASTAATTATAATVPINAVNAEAAAASTSGLSKLYKIRQNMNVAGAASWSAMPADNAMPAPSAPPAMGALLADINQVNPQAPGDAGMPDAVSVAQIDEISTGGNFAFCMAQVFIFFEIQDHLRQLVWDGPECFFF